MSTIKIWEFQTHETKSHTGTDRQYAWTEVKKLAILSIVSHSRILADRTNDEQQEVSDWKARPRCKGD